MDCRAYGRGGRDNDGDAAAVPERSPSPILRHENSRIEPSLDLQTASAIGICCGGCNKYLPNPHSKQHSVAFQHNRKALDSPPLTLYTSVPQTL